LFALYITEKGLGWSRQKRPHAPPDIANYLMLSVVITKNSLSKHKEFNKNGRARAGLKKDDLLMGDHDD